MKTDKETMTIQIYYLKDPRTDEIRYVGMTSHSDLKLRLWKHISDARRVSKKSTTYKDNWIRSLLKVGLEPTIHLIGVTAGFSLGSRVEIDTIKRFKELGYRLTNLSDGGEGVSGEYSSKKLKRKFLKRNHVVSGSRRVYQFKLDGSLLNCFDSITLAEVETGVFEENIRKVISGSYRHAGGFLWSLTRNPPELPEKIKHVGGVDQFTREGKFIRSWKSATEAANSLGLQFGNILGCARGHYGFKTSGGFIWRYAANEKVKRNTNK